jgi:DNA-binding NarL/FixJ family response regulator
VGPLTVVLADDHQVVRSGLRADLGDGFRVVGEASDAAEAIALTEQHRPDLVVCDVHMPGGGATVAERCSAMTSVVMFSVSDAERDVLDAVASGAVGYLSKATPTDELRAALHDAAAGKPVFSPALAMLVLGEFRRLSRTATGQNPLSDREREVLVEVAKGHSYRTIAEHLYISPRTVENHVRNILSKLHLQRREELIAYAKDHQIT